MNIPNSYDMLAVNGILPYDVNEIVTGKPSDFSSFAPNTLDASPKKDEFSLKNPKKPNEVKKIGLAVLATYIAGVILSKGKTSPTNGAEAILNTATKILKLPLKLLKKKA